MLGFRFYYVASNKVGFGILNAIICWETRVDIVYIVCLQRIDDACDIMGQTQRVRIRHVITTRNPLPSYYKKERGESDCLYLSYCAWKTQWVEFVIFLLLQFLGIPPALSAGYCLIMRFRKCFYSLIIIKLSRVPCNHKQAHAWGGDVMLGLSSRHQLFNIMGDRVVPCNNCSMLLINSAFII